MQQLVRHAGREPSPDDNQEIERKRHRLSSHIQEFHTTAIRLVGSTTVNDRIGNPDILDEDSYVSDELHDEWDPPVMPFSSAIENTALVFPSSLVGHLNVPIQDLCQRELQLQRAKANNALTHIWESLSGLSYQYINKVRQSSTTKEPLRAFKGVRLLASEVSYHRQVYNRSRQSILNLDKELKHCFPYLAASECKISTAIADVNARGQSQVHLSWFWGAMDGYDPEISPEVASDNNRLLECAYNIC